VAGRRKVSDCAGATQLGSVLSFSKLKSRLFVHATQKLPPSASHHHFQLLSTMASSSSSSKEAADATLRAPMPSIDWLQCMELGYVGESSQDNPVCFLCGKSNVKLSKCAKCCVAGYCSRDCQVEDWKTGTGGGHRHSCQGM